MSLKIKNSKLIVKNRKRLYWILIVLTLTVLVNASIVILLATVRNYKASSWLQPAVGTSPIRNFRAISQRMIRLAGSPHIKLKLLGDVRYGGATLPIVGLFFAYQSECEQKRRILLTGCVHGNEIAGGEALLQFLGDLAVDPTGYESVCIDTIPIVNPWGWIHNTRYNGDGEDINRDFSTSRSQEAKILKDFILSRGEYDLAVDLHESKKPGYFVYDYIRKNESFSGIFIDTVADYGKPVEQEYREFGFRVRDGILRIPAPLLIYVKLARRYSLDHYMRTSFTQHAYTFETPLADPFAHRISVHRDAVDGFLKALMSE